MSTDIQTTKTQLPVSEEAQNIAREAGRETTFQAMIKFKKGDYWCDGDQIPLGTTMIAHAIGWTKVWIKFENRTVVDRRMYRVDRKEICPERSALPDQDASLWPNGLDGRPADPWTLQYLLPLEDPETGEVRIFVGGSSGGRRAVAGLCTAYGRRVLKGLDSQPIIELHSGTFPSPRYGDVICPVFKIVGWDDAATAQVRVSEATVKRDEFQDEIPF